MTARSSRLGTLSLLVPVTVVVFDVVANTVADTVEK